MKPICYALILGISSALVAIAALYAHMLTAIELWSLVLANPSFVPECNAHLNQDRGRFIFKQVISDEECATVHAALMSQPGVPSSATDWGSKLHDNFRSHFVHDWQGMPFAESARKVIAKVLLLQRKILDDPDNAFLQSHDLTIRSQINLSRPITLFDRLPWAVRTSEVIGELCTGAQNPHADNCSLQINPWTRVQSAQVSCTIKEPRPEFCCLNRTYTAAVFLNAVDAVDGGRFLFWDPETVNLWTLNTGFCHVKPTCGNLVMFPSDVNHIHAVTPVTRGDRGAIMTWYTNREDPDTEKAILTPASEWEHITLPKQRVSYSREVDSAAGVLAPVHPPGYVAPVVGASDDGDTYLPADFQERQWHPEHGNIPEGWDVDANGNLIEWRQVDEEPNV
jgi:hypothetical protein